MVKPDYGWKFAFPDMPEDDWNAMLKGEEGWEYRLSWTQVLASPEAQAIALALNVRAKANRDRPSPYSDGLVQFLEKDLSGNLWLKKTKRAVRGWFRGVSRRLLLRFRAWLYKITPAE